MHSAHMAVPAADGHLRPDTAPGAYAFNWHSRASCAGCWSVPSGYVMTTVSKALLGCAAVEWLLMIALAVTIVIEDLKDGTAQNPSLVYAVLSVYVVVAHALFTADAIIAENKFQFYVSQIVGFLMTMMVCFFVWFHPYTLGQEWRLHLRWVMFGTRCIMQLVYFALAWPVLDSFGYVQYKLAGADVRLGELYKVFKQWLSLLKVDAVVFFFLLLLAKFFLLEVRSTEFIIGVVSVIFGVLWAVLGWVGVVQERTFLVYVFMLASLVQPAWVAYKLYYLDVHPGALPAQVSFAQFAVVGGLFLITRGATLFMTCQCMRNFGLGLREQVFLQAVTREAREAFMQASAQAPHVSPSKDTLRAPLMTPSPPPAQASAATVSRLQDLYADDSDSVGVPSGSEGGINADQAGTARMDRMMREFQT